MSQACPSLDKSGLDMELMESAQELLGTECGDPL